MLLALRQKLVRQLFFFSQLSFRKYQELVLLMAVFLIFEYEFLNCLVQGDFKVKSTHCF